MLIGDARCDIERLSSAPFFFFVLDVDNPVRA
jgi:hypothetical protein